MFMGRVYNNTQHESISLTAKNFKLLVA